MSVPTPPNPWLQDWDRSDNTSLLTSWVENVLQAHRSTDKVLGDVYAQSPAKQREIKLLDNVSIAEFKTQCESSERSRLASAIYIYGRPTGGLCSRQQGTELFESCIKLDKKFHVLGCSNCVWNGETYCRAFCQDSMLVVKKLKKTKQKKRKKTSSKTQKKSKPTKQLAKPSARMLHSKNHMRQESDEPEDMSTASTRPFDIKVKSNTVSTRANHSPDRQMRFAAFNNLFQSVMDLSENVGQRFASPYLNTQSMKMNRFQNNAKLVTGQAKVIQGLLLSGMRQTTGSNHNDLREALRLTRECCSLTENMREAIYELRVNMDFVSTMEILDDEWGFFQNKLSDLVDDVVAAPLLDTLVKVEAETRQEDTMDQSSG